MGLQRLVELCSKLLIHIALTGKEQQKATALMRQIIIDNWISAELNSVF